MEIVLPRNKHSDFDPVLNQAYNTYRASLPLIIYKNCFITYSGVGIKQFQLLPETIFFNVSARMKRHFYTYALYNYLFRKKIYLDLPKLLTLHNHWSSGYHHWLTECLIKIQFFNSSEYTLIIPEDYPTFVFESLNLFPFKNIVKIPVKTGVKVKSICVVGNPYSGTYNPQHLASLKLQLIAGCKQNYTAITLPAAERIYVSRENERLRKVENETEVIRLLKQYNFTVIDPTRLSFKEQVLLFSGCKFFVSIHGAALTNCLYMPINASVLELYRALTPTHNYMNTCYWHLSTASGLKYYYQFCEHGSNNDTNIDKVNIIVNLEKLKSTIELMLANA